MLQFAKLSDGTDLWHFTIHSPMPLWYDISHSVDQVSGMDAEKQKAWPRGCSSSRKLGRNFDCGNLGCSCCRQANILLSRFTALERVTPPSLSSARWCLLLNETTICKQWRACALQTVTRPLQPRLHCRYTSYCVTLLEIAIPRHLTLSVRRVIEPPKKLVQGMTCFLVRGFPSMCSHRLMVWHAQRVLVILSYTSRVGGS